MNELEEWQGKKPSENNENENREGFFAASSRLHSL